MSYAGAAYATRPYAGGATSTPIVGSSLTYLNDGYNYDGLSDNLTPVPVVPPPPDLAEVVAQAQIKRVHHSMPVPTIVDGAPQGWVGTVIEGETWGRIRVTIDDVDVTYWRDAPTVVADSQLVDPYGYATLDLTFPQLTELEDRAEVAPWLRDGAVVKVERVVNDVLQEDEYPPFEGLIDSISQFWPTQVTCSGKVSGRWATRLHQPHVVNHGPRDGGRIVDHCIDNRSHWWRFHTAEVGIELRWNGSRNMTTLGAVDDALSRLVDDDGTTWTILPDPALGHKDIRLQPRQLSAGDFTVHAGAHGVKAKPREDRVDKVNTIYGEGVAPSGERWRNAKYPNLPPHYAPPFPHSAPLERGMTNQDTDSGDGISILVRELWSNGVLAYDDDTTISTREFDAEVEDAVQEVQRDLNVARTGVVDEDLWKKIFMTSFEHMSFRGARFEPLAEIPETHYFNRGPDGSVIGINREWTRDVEPMEQFIGYGNQVTKREARRNSRGIIARSAAINGTMTLTSDPAEMSRLDIRPGMTGKVCHLFGTGLAGTKVYVSSVQIDWADPRLPVTLAWSTNPRHYIDLATIKARQMEARRDPAAHWRHQLRRSTIVSDVDGWEGESGAGIVRRIELKGGRWNVFPMVAAARGQVGDFRLDIDPGCPFYLILFGDRIGPGRIWKRIGNPNVWHDKDKEESKFDHHSEWLRDQLAIEWWGRPDQRPGYFPKEQTTANGKPSGHPANGRFRDEGMWEFFTRKGFLYVAVYPMNDGVMTGRARIVAGDGN